MSLTLHTSCQSLVSYIHQYVSPGLLEPSANENSHSEPFKNTRFFALALKSHMDDALEWADNLKGKPAPPDWHLIKIHDRGEFVTSVSHSKDNAVAYAAEQLDKSGIFITNVVRGPESVDFVRDGVIVASVSPLPVTPASTELSERVAKCLSKVSAYATTSELRKCFNSIRGLSLVSTWDGAERPFRPFIITSSSLSNQMADFLSRVSSRKFSRSEVLEITAKFHGFDNWNLFTGAEKKHAAAGLLKEPYCISGASENGEVFTLGVADALAHFAWAAHNCNEVPQSMNISRLYGVFGSANYSDGNNIVLRKLESVQAERGTGGTANHIELDSYISEICVPAAGIQRLTQRGHRRSIDGQCMICGNWLVYVESGHSGHDQLVFERYNDKLTECVERILASQYKRVSRDSGNFSYNDD